MTRQGEVLRNPFDRAGFLPVLRRWWWLLVLAAVAAGVIGHLVSSRSEPTYESRVQLVVGPINTDLDTQRAAGQLAQLYVELATSRPVLDATVQELALPQTASELRANVLATANATTRVLTIRVRGATPEITQAAAAALANNVIELARQDTNRPEGQLSVFDPAQPGSEIGVDTTFVVALAALAGLLAAFTLVLLVEYLRNTTRDDSELAELAQTRSLGLLDVRGRDRSRLVAQLRPDSDEAAFYRLLAAEIEFIKEDRAPRTLLLLGVAGGEGSGTMAANLGATFALAGKRVVLLDASQLEGEITALFGIDGQPGVNDLLRDEAARASGRTHRLVRATPLSGLEVLPRGNVDAADPVGPERVGELLSLLLERADLVLVGADPVRRSPRTLSWARAAEGTILVATAGQVKRDAVVDATEGLRLVGANLVGTVMTRGLRGGAPQRRAARAPRAATAPQEGPAPERADAEPTGDVPRLADVSGAGKAPSRRRGA